MKNTEVSLTTNVTGYEIRTYTTVTSHIIAWIMSLPTWYSGDLIWRCGRYLVFSQRPRYKMDAQISFQLARYSRFWIKYCLLLLWSRFIFLLKPDSILILFLIYWHNFFKMRFINKFFWSKILIIGNKMTPLDRLMWSKVIKLTFSWYSFLLYRTITWKKL